jgi:hypothetical protein
MASDCLIRPISFSRWLRPLVFGAACAWTFAYLAYRLHGWFGAHLGWDFSHYLTAVKDWLHTGSPYSPAAIAGPYVADAATMPFLHPPIALALFAPFLVLPAILWWAAPVAVLIVCLRQWRPGGWGWYGVLACAVYPRTLEVLLVGNSDLWVAGLLAGGLLLGWPAALLIVKPTAIPFALMGIRRRSWWIAAGLVILAALPFGVLWRDWVSVVVNVADSGTYLVHSLPLYVLPLIAWRHRSRHPLYEEATGA